MGRRRQRFDGALKSRAALDAVRGLKTVSRLAALHKVHPTRTAPWKKQLLDGAAEVFDSCFSGKSFGWKAASGELYKRIGRLPASRALPIGMVIWYADHLETPGLTQGTQTPQTHAHDGRTQPDGPKSDLRPLSSELFHLSDLVIRDVIGVQDMENPYRSPAEMHKSRSAKSRLFVIVRVTTLGLAGSGSILAALPLLVAMPALAAARCEIRGGALIVLAGALLLLAMFLARGKMPRPSTHHWISGCLCLTLGSNLFAKGYGTESARTKRFNEMKSNLNQLKQAIENYEARAKEQPRKAP